MPDLDAFEHELIDLLDKHDIPYAIIVHPDKKTMRVLSLGKKAHDVAMVNEAGSVVSDALAANRKRIEQAGRKAMQELN